MIEETLRALLTEPNLSANVISRAVAEALKAWKSSDRSSNAIDHLRRTMQTLTPDFYLRGPVAELNSTKLRVSRVLDEHTLWEHFVRSSSFVNTETRWGNNFSFRESNVRPEHMRQSPTGARNSVTWVTLEDEIRSFAADETAANLGLEFYTRNERLVALSYVIDASHLRIPTVLDAGCSPLFSIKMNPSEPRALNWRTGRVGAIELVHSSDAPVSDVTVRLIGRTMRPETILPFGAISIGVTTQVETAVATALRRVQALSDVDDFVGGENDILKLSPRQFEQFLGALFSLRGYQATVTKATRDGGFDVIAVADLNNQERLLLQAKKTRGRVGLSVIRELAGARWEAGLDESHILVVATTGRFSKPARELERQRPTLLRLHDYSDLKAMLVQARGVTFTDIALDAIALARFP